MCTDDQTVYDTCAKLSNHPRISTQRQYAVEYMYMKQIHNYNSDWEYTPNDYVMQAMFMAIDSDVKKHFDHTLLNCCCTLL